jgi:hypothetical protein
MYGIKKIPYISDKTETTIILAERSDFERVATVSPCHRHSFDAAQI